MSIETSSFTETEFLFQQLFQGMLQKQVNTRLNDINQLRKRIINDWINLNSDNETVINLISFSFTF